MTHGPAAGSAVPDPPARLDCSLLTLPEGTILHRIHETKFGGTNFNPGFGNSRFAPFALDGIPVPTCYAATSLECALFETIFHDIDPAHSFKMIRSSKLAELSYSTLEVIRDLKLARLFTPDLMKWKLARSQLIDTPRSEYSRTRLWCPPIHDSLQEPQGMVWTSRAFDEEKAVILFGSRIDEVGDLVCRSTVPVARDHDCLKTVADLAERADILIAR